MHGRRVPKDVWRDSAGGGALVRKPRGMPPDEFVDAESRERLAPRGTEDRSLRHGRFTRKQSQQTGRLIPKGARAPLVALPMQPGSRATIEIDVFDAEVGRFLHSRAGVVQKEEERAISHGVSP